MSFGKYELLVVLSFFIFCMTQLKAQNEVTTFQNGDWRLLLGLPYVNQLSIQTNENALSHKAGFIGESIGAEYSYSDSKFLALSFSFVGVTKTPIPLPFDREGAFTSQYTSYFSLTHNHQVQRWSAGYGLNLSTNTWVTGYRSFSDSIPSFSEEYRRRTLGLSTNCYYRFTKSFHLGLQFRPTFLQVQPKTRFKYEHLFSLEFLWRIGGAKKRKGNNHQK